MTRRSRAAMDPAVQPPPPLLPLMLLVLLQQVLLPMDFITGVAGVQVEVVTFQPDGVARMDTIGVYRGKLDLNVKLTALTMCGRFKIFFMHGRDTIFQLRNEADKLPWMLKAEVWPEKVRPAISARWNFVMLKEMLQTFKWYHLCFTYSPERQVISTWMSGNLVNELKYLLLANRTVYGDYFYIGQGIDLSESFSGDITQVNVWDRVLTNDEIVALANCQIDLQGNFASWKTGFELKNANSRQVDLQDLCYKDTGSGYFFFPDMTYTTSYYLCEALGSRLPMPRTRAESGAYLDTAAKLLGAGKKCTSEIVVGSNDIENDGTWTKYYDNSLFESDAWNNGEPNGYIYENCAQLENGGIADIDCITRVQCVMCEFQEIVVFALKGTCENELRNINFLSYQYAVGELLFRGYGAYTIEKINKKWVWINSIDNSTIATMDISYPNFPMGRRSWTLSSPVCDQSSGKRMLLLTHCKPNQFSCDDATCIPLENRCDLKYDCLDHSDEVDCQMVVIPSDYKMDLPPRRSKQHGVSTLPVAIKIVVEHMEIVTTDMIMQLSYDLTQTWFDTRLTFINLKTNITLNVLSYDTIQSVWSPTLSFVNTDENALTSVNHEASIQVERLKPPFKIDGTKPTEVELFSGATNPMSIIKKYSNRFICDFNLMLYPFDNQYCDIHLKMLSASSAYLKFDLNNSVASYTGSQFLVEYEIGFPEIVDVPNTEFSEMRIRIPLKRRSGYAILNIYTPSLILIFISYATLFFRVHIFEVRIMTALTALLVEATLFAQVSGSLPKTSYFKMVDVWLLFSIVIIFLIIIFHSIIDYLLEYNPIFDKHALQRTINIDNKLRPMNGIPMLRNPETPTTSSLTNALVLISQVSVSVLFVIFNILYWAFILG